MVSGCSSAQIRFEEVAGEEKEEEEVKTIAKKWKRIERERSGNQTLRQQKTPKKKKMMNRTLHKHYSDFTEEEEEDVPR